MDVLDTFFVFLIAVSPILQNYKGPLINAGITVMLLTVPYVAMKLLWVRAFPAKVLGILAPIYVFQIFKVVDHGTSVTELGLAALYIVYTFVFCCGIIEPRLFVRVVTVIGCVASVLIMLQYVCYYFLGFHLQLVPTSMLLPGSSQWIGLAQTGRISITGRTMAFYRPSSFFLEPSHMFTYLCGPLLYDVLSQDEGPAVKRRAYLLSCGMVLSTSGMGLMATVGIWLLYLAKKGGLDQRFNPLKLLQPRNMAVFLGGAAAFAVLYLNVDFFKRSINRIFFSDTDYVNAVSGRISGGSQLISELKGLSLWFGLGDHYADVKVHMTAFNATMYKFGIIGTVLSYLFYLKAIVDLKGKYPWFAFMLVGISYFAPHTHGTFYMLFFIIFLLEGYRDQVLHGVKAGR